MFLLFSFLESIKITETYLSNFQSSAGGSQAGVADLVQSIRHKPLRCASTRNFCGYSYPARRSVVQAGDFRL
jgi:hypothetical protein